MALFQGFLDMLRGKKNVTPSIATAISDDGSGDAIAVGELSPLRADPSTGALIVTGSAGAAIGSVTQGAGSDTSPWYVRSKLSTTGPVPLTAKTVPTGTAEAVASSTPVTKFVRVTSDFANTKTVYVSGSTVTTANGQPLGPGDTYTYTDIDNAALIFCISADAAQVLRVEVL
jgi:hypothetical protein